MYNYYEHKRLHTPNPTCQWCVWNNGEGGKNYLGQKVYYPLDYCGYHGKLHNTHEYYIFDGYEDENIVFECLDYAYEWGYDHQMGYKDSLYEQIFSVDYSDLNEDQKDVLRYKHMII